MPTKKVLHILSHPISVIERRRTVSISYQETSAVTPNISKRRFSIPS